MTSEAELERRMLTPEEIQERGKKRLAAWKAYQDRLDAESAELTAKIGDGLKFNRRTEEAPRVADLIRKLIRIEIERYEFRELTIDPQTRARERGLFR